jgi:bifunctional UDP-N-acetylglucosamine pyrophosphorylase/glucosamine-1-phosphate N-acetyltransferase
MITGIILAAGKGSRFGATGMSKTVVPLLGKPLVNYGVELLKKTTDKVVVVTGAFSETVEECVKPLGVETVLDAVPQGTGWSFAVATKKIEELGVEPELVIVGYGDHMMFYKEETINKLVEQIKSGAKVSMVAAVHTDPNSLKWGRIVRNENGEVEKIIEQKDATEEERQIQELNAGLYAFDWKFAKQAVSELQPSAVTGEYYLTDLIGMAVNKKEKVGAVAVPFEQVGYGINTPEELKAAEELLKQAMMS